MRPQFHAQVRSPARHAAQAAVRARCAAFVLTVTSVATTALSATLLAAAPARAEEPVERSSSLQWRAEPGSLRLDGQGWVARLDLRSVELDRLPSRSGRPAWQLLGDYYFGAGTPGAAFGSASATGPGPLAGTGLRATGGLIGLLPRSQSSAREPAMLTYLGLGYSLGLDRPGWGVKADLGLLGTRDGSGGLRLNRSGASMEDASVGDLRWLPLLQVGVSYAF
ncbi:MAG: hypothetical protein RLZZ524_2788 [Pseudomonadota bacterium]